MTSADAIRTNIDRYIDAFSTGQREMWLDLFADEATMEDPVGSPIRTGRVEIEAFWDWAHAVADEVDFRPGGPPIVVGHQASFAFVTRRATACFGSVAALQLRGMLCLNGGVTKSRTPEESRRRGVRLEWATNGWNVMEVVVTISLGLRAGSLALIAFGLQSVVEIFASTVVIRNLRDDRLDIGDRRVHRSLRLIAVAFWVLAAFLAVISLRGLIRGDRPASSPLGVAYLALTAFVMFGLAHLKRATAAKLGSEPLHAEAALTFLDGCLSTGILTALVLNAWLGWWWTDAAAALLVAAFAIKEGVDHWRQSAPHEEEPEDVDQESDPGARRQSS